MQRKTEKMDGTILARDEYSERESLFFECKCANDPGSKWLRVTTIGFQTERKDCTEMNVSHSTNYSHKASSSYS